MNFEHIFFVRIFALDNNEGSSEQVLNVFIYHRFLNQGIPADNPRYVRWGFSFFVMQRIINIPVSLLKRFKNDKKSLEMLACAFIIKANYQHSVLYNVSVTHVMKFFGCSYKKAVKLMDSFGDCDLLIYNKEKQCLYAKSFKDKTPKTYGHKENKKYNAISDYCCKVEYKDGETLRETVRKFRNILLVNAIAAREKGNFNVGQTNPSVTKPSTQTAMPQRLLGNVIGLSRSSANRYIKRLVETNVVSKSGIVAECVINELNDETEAEYKRLHPEQRYSVWHNQNGGWSAWVVYGFTYSLMTKASAFVFRNVIYNYRFPMYLKPTTSSEIDGKWA